MGATAVVDPRDEKPTGALARTGGGANPVIFEAVGSPGVLDEAMHAAPRMGRVIVVGVCMERDTIWPLLGISKELSVHFALGYDPLEFRRTLDLIASGEIDVAPLITDEVPIDGVAGAFKALGNPEKHAKILVTPNEG
jgi:threonine dehydrogenase-like Zn-dependent dehydrogenase